MDDFNQIEVAPSFLALFTPPGGHRLTQPMKFVRERYELCEDMAQMLVDQASTAQFKSGAGEQQVLVGMRQALTGEVLQAEEAGWVVTRLAELLGWEAPSSPS